MLASFSNSGVPARRARHALLLLVLAVVGCSEQEIDRPGTWRPVGANDRNLRAMLADPADAYAGTGAATSRGDSGARAVTRLLTDRRRQLLDASSSRLSPTGSSGTDAPLSTGATTQ